MRDNSTMQDLFDGVLKRMERARAETQMTLGEVIARLKELPPDLIIKGLGDLDSYRGYYSDLAFGPDERGRTVERLLGECTDSMGKVFYGYKGGEYPMHALTPLWVAPYGHCGLKLIAINGDGTIETREDES